MLLKSLTSFSCRPNKVAEMIVSKAGSGPNDTTTLAVLIDDVRESNRRQGTFRRLLEGLHFAHKACDIIAARPG